MRRAWALNELEEERGSEGGREERERERVNVCNIMIIIYRV